MNAGPSSLLLLAAGLLLWTACSGSTTTAGAPADGGGASTVDPSDGGPDALADGADPVDAPAETLCDAPVPATTSVSLQCAEGAGVFIAGGTPPPGVYTLNAATVVRGLAGECNGFVPETTAASIRVVKSSATELALILSWQRSGAGSFTGRFRAAAGGDPLTLETPCGSGAPDIKLRYAYNENTMSGLDVIIEEDVPGGKETPPLRYRFKK